MIDATSPRYTIDLAATASTALRVALGLPPRSMTTDQFVGLISEEVEQLRAEGWSDGEIASLIHEATGEPIGAENLRPNSRVQSAPNPAQSSVAPVRDLDDLAAEGHLATDAAAHSAGDLNYRGHRLTVDHQGAFWQVSVRANLPDQTELNLPVYQDADREKAIQNAKDLVDELVDGRPLGELAP